jgi:hypothetical protein
MKWWLLAVSVTHADRTNKLYLQVRFVLEHDYMSARRAGAVDPHPISR